MGGYEDSKATHSIRKEKGKKIPGTERYSRSVGHRDGRVYMLENAM